MDKRVTIADLERRLAEAEAALRANNDFDARRWAEAALRESEKRQAFLLKLSDALRVEPDADAVANRALKMLLDRLGLDRCYITYYRPADNEADFPYQVGNDTVPPLPGKVRLSDFPDAYNQVLEKTFVIDDDFERRGLSEAERASSRSLGMRAMVASTVRRGEEEPSLLDGRDLVAPAPLEPRRGSSCRGNRRAHLGCGRARPRRGGAARE